MARGMEERENGGRQQGEGGRVSESEGGSKKRREKKWHGELKAYREPLKVQNAAESLSTS